MQNKISQPFRESRLLTVPSCFPKTPAVNTITNPVLSLFHKKMIVVIITHFFRKINTLLHSVYFYTWMIFPFGKKLPFYAKNDCKNKQKRV